MLKLIKQARAALSLLNPDEVRQRIAQPVSFGLVAATDAAFEEMEAFLMAGFTELPGSAKSENLVYRAGEPGVPENVDLVLYYDGIPGPKGTYSFHRGDPERTAEQIVRDNDDLALALARRYPAFRKAVVERTIHAVARENAFFAIASALPDVIPSFVELPWAFGEFASDTAFMTANQVRMAFMIAGACGKEVGYAERKVEIAAIAAGAFGWRAIARELAGKIPFGGGLIPKGAIAYAVTYALGKGLEQMHGAGAPQTREQKQETYRQAFERGRRVAGSITAAEQAGLKRLPRRAATAMERSAPAQPRNVRAPRG